MSSTKRSDRVNHKESLPGLKLDLKLAREMHVLSGNRFLSAGAVKY